MAYGLKYELLCKSRAGKNYKLQLHFNGYTDADIDRNMGLPSPLVLKKDRAAIVRGTSLDFSIREETDFELDEFYTNDPKKIKALLYDGNTLLWAGYNLPQQYQAPYVSAPLTIRFTATDGLGLLKNEAFTLTGLKSQLEIIIYCINKIGLGLGYSIAISIVEITHNASLSALAQTYEYAELYEDYDCYTVLERILEKYNAEITQASGRWHITSYSDKKSTRMLYTSAGVYEGTENAPAVLDMGMPEAAGIDVYPIGSFTRGMEPGGKKIIITHNYGRKNSLLANASFWKYSGGNFTGWTKSGSFTMQQLICEGKAYARLGETSNMGDQIYQEIAVVAPSGHQFNFEMNIAAIGRDVSGYKMIPVGMTVKFAVSLNSGATTYYLTENGEWTTDATIIAKQITSSLFTPTWTKVSIIANNIPISGDLTVALYAYDNTEPARPDVSYIASAFSDVNVFFTTEGQLYASGLKTLAEFTDSTEPNDLGTLDIKTADAPDYDNNGLLYDNITRLSNGDPTTLWFGDAPGVLLIVWLAQQIASMNRVAREKLNGTIKGSSLNLSSIIKHAYNNDKEFEIAECSWDLYEEKWSVTLLEILAYDSPTITFTNVTENASSFSSNETGKEGAGSVAIVGNRGVGLIESYFEIVDKGLSTEYIRCKKTLGSIEDIVGYAGSSIDTIWEFMPVAEVGVRGGIDLPGDSDLFLNGAGNWTEAAGGTGMTWPGSAGIALYGGSSAWGTSIANNSANWNTAYGWGNHASAGYLTAITKAMVEGVLTGTISSHDHSGLYLSLSGGTISGNLFFYNDATERFIKSSVNGGAIRIRGNSTSGSDRGLKIGQVDNTNAWVAEWMDFREGSGSTGIVSVNGGLHVGGTSDPGDNNILADGVIRSAGDVVAYYSA